LQNTVLVIFATNDVTVKVLFHFSLLFAVFFPASISVSGAQSGLPPAQLLPWQTGFRTPWVDSVLATLTLEERIAQLFMIEVRPTQDPGYYDRLEQIVRQYNPGGLIFFRGGPVRQVHATNRLQAVAQTPLLIGMDAEWGPAMRLDSVVAFPHQLTMGATPGTSLVYQMGLEAGLQLRRLGVHISFSPVLDVNNNPQNPVINFRSFGEYRHNVSHKGLAYMRGLQDAGVIASAKHFPGHGDTHLDSHYTLPLLELSRQEFDSIHIFPFRHLINNGLHSVMVAHLHTPALDPQKNLASSLSKRVVNDLLIEELGFRGLIITDALNMQGVSDHFQPGDLELRAFLAGNDILLMPQDLPAAIGALRRAVASGRVSREMLDYRVRKILFYKELVGLNRFKPICTHNLIVDLNPWRVQVLNNRIAKAAITLVHNEDAMVPVRNLANRRIAVLSLGADKGNAFQGMLANYARMAQYSLPKAHTPAQAAQMVKALDNYDLVIVGVHHNNQSVARNFGITADNISFLTSLARQQSVILTLFANPYSLISFGADALHFNSILIAYQEGRHFEEAAAQVIFGGIDARGRLPVSAPPHFPVFTGFNTPENFRIQFSYPEEAGIDANLLGLIDNLVYAAMDSMAFPGSQVAIIKDGHLIYHKAFGYHTYDRQQAVQPTDLYDLASITKIAATTVAMMKLVDQDIITMRKKLSDYLELTNDSTLSRLELRDIMAHQARLRPWIPFFETTIQNGHWKPGFYSDSLSEEFPVRVAENMYLAASFRDSIYHRILKTPLQKRRNYLYSDIGFILLGDLIKQQSGIPLDKFMGQNFFEPMGLTTMTFNPLEKFEVGRIAPSQNDTLWRRQVIRGFVNDPAAAMLGGIAGHAGLFSNALDLAKMMLMLERGGVYGGEQFILPNTIREFTRVQFAGNQNRRGLGFDKPSINPKQESPASESASPLSYGHSGFTGTFAWVDPTVNLVVVFLSNRTFPYTSNRKINTLDVRRNIQEAVYNALRLSTPFSQPI